MDEREEDLPPHCAMARALGMNPGKLSRLRPGRQQRWKLPVGEFIEDCVRNRFGGNARDEHPSGAEEHLRKPSPTICDAGVPARGRDPAGELSDLVCNFNLAGDLRQWLGHGSIDPEVLFQVREELLEIVKAL